MTSDREEDSDFWWSGATCAAFPLVDPLEDRLRQTFQAVLRRIPQEAFDTFMENDPLVLCQTGANAQVFDLPFVAPSNNEPTEGFLVVMYFSPHVSRLSEANLFSVFAHEIAHVVLGDHHIRWGVKNSEREEAADQLSDSWGFKKSYSRRVLGRMRDGERKIDALNCKAPPHRRPPSEG